MNEKLNTAFHRTIDNLSAAMEGGGGGGSGSGSGRFSNPGALPAQTGHPLPVSTASSGSLTVDHGPGFEPGTASPATAPHQAFTISQMSKGTLS